jgi:hypothetical protein
MFIDTSIQRARYVSGILEVTTMRLTIRALQ